jgi:hypothetical protein
MLPVPNSDQEAGREELKPDKKSSGHHQHVGSRNSEQQPRDRHDNERPATFTRVFPSRRLVVLPS